MKKLIIILILFFIPSYLYADLLKVKNTEFYKDEIRGYTVLKGVIEEPENKKISIFTKFENNLDPGLESVIVTPHYQSGYNSKDLYIFAKKRNNEIDRSLLEFEDSISGEKVKIEWDYSNPSQGESKIASIWEGSVIDYIWSYYERGGGRI